LTLLTKGLMVPLDCRRPDIIDQRQLPTQVENQHED
jgi:hypothetical protein